jgi:hypothetical protein
MKTLQRIAGVLLGMSVLGIAAYGDDVVPTAVIEDQGVEAVTVPVTPIFEIPENQDQIWIDGDAIRAYLYSLGDISDPAIAPLLSNIMGARLTRKPYGLDVELHFTGNLSLPLKNPEDAKQGDLYRIDVPAVLYFEMRMKDGFVTLSSLSSSIKSRLRLKIKLRMVPDSVYLMGGTLDLVDGKLVVEAGVFSGSVIVVAKADLLEKRFDGVSFWGTVMANLKRAWPFSFKRKHKNQ